MIKINLFNKSEDEMTLHLGEIYHTWEHLNMSKSCMSKFSLLKNHTDDKDLKKFIDDIQRNMIKPEIKDLEEILLDNGIEIPPSAKKHPRINAETIPPGGRFSDKEIANCIANDLKQAMTSSSMVISLSTNEKLAMFFAKHHEQIVKYGGKMLKLMKEKEWITIPPLQKKTPELV